MEAVTETLEAVFGDGSVDCPIPDSVQVALDQVVVRFENVSHARNLAKGEGAESPSFGVRLLHGDRIMESASANDAAVDVIETVLQSLRDDPSDIIGGIVAGATRASQFSPQASMTTSKADLHTSTRSACACSYA